MERSQVILAGNHKALSRMEGHNGKVESFQFQEAAFSRACEAYRATIEKAVPAYLYTTIDHLSGKRVLTGKRNNAELLQLQDLVEVVRAPLQAVLKQHEIDPAVLRIIPEKTLIEHSRRLHESGVLNEAGACAAFRTGGSPVCKGLAGAYMDYAARHASQDSKVGFLDFFVEQNAGVPSMSIYTSGASIVRHGLQEKRGFPLWTEHVKIRGFNCIDRTLQRIA